MTPITHNKRMDVDTLTGLLSNLTLEVRGNTELTTATKRASAFLDTITPLEAGRYENCRPWINSMEIYFMLARTPEYVKVSVALITTRGVTRDYVNRIIKANPNITWPVLKASLIEYHGEDTQPEKFLKRLTCVKQGGNEDIGAYYHRVVALGEKAFTGAPARDPTRIRLVKYFFIRGLHSASVRLAVRRGAPLDVKDAYERSRIELQLMEEDNG